MSINAWALLFMAAVLAVIAVCGAIIERPSRRLARADRRADEWAHRMLAFIPPDQAAVVRSIFIGGRFPATLLLWVAAALGLWSVMGVDSPTSAELAMVVGVASVGLGLLVIETRHQAARLIDAGLQRSARPRAVGMSDYLPTPLRWLGPVSVGGLLGLLAWNVVSSQVDPGTVLFVLVAASVVGCYYLVVEWSARKVAAAPSGGPDACAMYWQDALRARFMATAFRRGQLLVLLPLMALLSNDGATGATALSQLAVFAGLVLSALASSALSASEQRPERLRKRLWPTLAAGQVLMPGDTVPPKKEMAVL